MRKSPSFILFVFTFILAISSFAAAQKNEVGIVFGGVVSPDSNNNVTGIACTTTFPFCSSKVSTDSVLGIEGVVAHRFVNLHLASFYVEVPIAGTPDRTVNQGGFTQKYSSLFFTPSLKLKLSAPGISPWLSVGGGFAHFSANDVAGVGGGGSTKGALQYGGGVDFSGPVPLLNLRFEVRDYYTGRPDLLVTQPTRHNVLIGGGVVVKF